jgi:hypothetical protein
MEASAGDPVLGPAAAISLCTSLSHEPGAWVAQIGRIPRSASACGSLEARRPGSIAHGGFPRGSRRPSAPWNSPRMRAKLRVIKPSSPMDVGRLSIGSSGSPGLHRSNVTGLRRRSRSRSDAGRTFRPSGRGCGGECARGIGRGTVGVAKPEELRLGASSSGLNQDPVPLSLCQLRRRRSASRSARKGYGGIRCVCGMV